MKKFGIILLIFGIFICIFPILMGTPELLTIYAPVAIINIGGAYWFWKKKQ